MSGSLAHLKTPAGRGPGNNGSASNIPPIELNQLDILNVRRDSNVFITGKRNSGKSNYLKHWLSFIANPAHRVESARGVKGSFGKIAVLSETEKYNHFYENEIGVDPDFIVGQYDSEFLLRLLRMQQYLAQRLPQESKRNLKHWLLIIMDDLAFNDKVQKDPSLAELMFNGRHMMTCVITLAQDSLAAERRSRTCYDYAICTRDNTTQGQRRLHECYYGLLSLPAFQSTMVKYTENYGVFIADNTKQADSVQGQYFWDRAPDYKDVVMKDYIHLDYSDATAFRGFLKKRYGMTANQDMSKRIDVLDAELRKELVTFYTNPADSTVAPPAPQSTSKVVAVRAKPYRSSAAFNRREFTEDDEVSLSGSEDEDDMQELARNRRARNMECQMMSRHGR